MFPFQYIISTTQRAVIQSTFNPSPIDLPPFTDIDNFTGTLTIVQETSDPNNPTIPFTDITEMSIRLIGDRSVAAAIDSIVNGVVNFTLNLEDNISAGEAIFEVVLINTENSICILNQDVVIQVATP